MMNHDNICGGKMYFLNQWKLKRMHIRVSEYIAKGIDRILVKYDQIEVCTDATATN